MKISIAFAMASICGAFLCGLGVRGAPAGATVPGGKPVQSAPARPASHSTSVQPAPVPRAAAAQGVPGVSGLPFRARALANFGLLRGKITLTAAASDSVTIQGVTPGSYCVAFPTNAVAASGMPWVSAVAANAVTITHAAKTAAGGTLNILCTVN